MKTKIFCRAIVVSTHINQGYAGDYRFETTPEGIADALNLFRLKHT